MDAVRISIRREEVPVILDTEDGTERSLVIREMIGKDRDTYLTRMGSKMKFNSAGKVVGVTSFDGLQAGLLVLCLFDSNTDKLLSVQEIQALPARAQNELFRIAQEINGLDEKAEESAKNDSGESDLDGTD